jgi:electron transport complex protein RnfG
MSDAQAQLEPMPATPVRTMFAVLMGVAMLAGFLVVATFQLTGPMIEENQRLATEAAVLRVIPGAVTQRDFVLGEEVPHLATGAEPARATHVYAGYDAQGALLGIAARGAAQGYAELVHLLYGYVPACQCIRGIKVLKLAETPGLGDKILTDPAFLANFDALDARLKDDGSGLAHPIETVKHGTKSSPWEIDAISGATISSKAVGRALNASADRLLPRVLPHLEVLARISHRGGEMIAPGFRFTRDFLTERNTRLYFRGKNIPCGFKDQARARHPGEKCGLEAGAPSSAEEGSP